MDLIQGVDPKDLAKALEEVESEEWSSDEDTKINYKGLTTWNKIRAEFESLASEQELQEWMSGALFKPRWMQYYENYWLKAQATSTNTRGENLESILRAIAAAEHESERRYIREDIDTTDWGAVDWLAKLFVQTYDDNEKDRNGLLFGKGWNKVRKQNIWWRLLIKIKGAHAKSQFNKPGGAKDKLSYTPEELVRFDEILLQCKSSPKGTPEKAPQAKEQQPVSSSSVPYPPTDVPGKAFTESPVSTIGDGDVKKAGTDSGPQAEDPKQVPSSSVPDPPTDVPGKASTESPVGQVRGDDVDMAGTDCRQAECAGEQSQREVDQGENPVRNNDTVDANDTAMESLAIDSGDERVSSDGAVQTPQRGADMQNKDSGAYHSKSSRPTAAARRARMRKPNPKKRKRGAGSSNDESPTATKASKRTKVKSSKPKSSKRKRPELEPSANYGPDDITKDAWRKELIDPDPPLVLVRMTETLDLTDPWWQYHVIEKALSLVEHAEQATEEEIQAVEDPFDENTVEPQNEEDATEEDLTSVGCIYSSRRYLHAESAQEAIVQMAAVGAQDGEEFAKVTSRIIPTEASVAAFDKQQGWFNNREYQRENHLEACRLLGIENPDVPKLKGMRAGIKLYFWQPVAMNGLLEMARDKLLRGALLADAVGLGKTWITVGFLMAVCNLNRCVPRKPFPERPRQRIG